MTEIIHIGFGNCGANIGLKVFEQLISEYQIEPNRVCEKQQEGMEVHFNEIGDKKFVPRALFKARDIDQIMSTPVGLYFNPNNYQQDLEDQIRIELESCNNFQGFQLSGHFSTQYDQFYEEKQIVQSFTVLPQTDQSSIEIIQSIINLHKTAEYNHIIFDNQSLNEYYSKSTKNTITYADYNLIIANVLTGITQPMRYNSINNTNLKKLYSIQSAINLETCYFVQEKVAFNFINIKDTLPLIKYKDINQRWLSANIFVKSATQAQSNLINQLGVLDYLIYPNIQYSISQSKQEQTIITAQSTVILELLKQYQEIYDKMKPRKPFDDKLKWDETQESYEYLRNLITIIEEINNTQQKQIQQDQEVQKAPLQTQQQPEKQQQSQQIIQQPIQSQQPITIASEGKGGPQVQSLRKIQQPALQSIRQSELDKF